MVTIHRLTAPDGEINKAGEGGPGQTKGNQGCVITIELTFELRQGNESNRAACTDCRDKCVTIVLTSVTSSDRPGCHLGFFQFLWTRAEIRTGRQDYRSLGLSLSSASG